MTPEQITMLLNMLSNMPTQAILMAAFYIAYKDGKIMLASRLEWLTGQLTAYMERDRQIVSDVVKRPTIPVASKYEPVPNGIPPAPG